MTTRIANPFHLVGNSAKAAAAFEKTLNDSGLDRTLLELVRLRAAQINGCAYCLQEHAAVLQTLGTSDMQMHVLAGWREATGFTARERAALGWTEALTRIAETHAPDDAYAALAAEFSEAEQVTLSLVIGAINMWNRVMIGFRVPPAA